MKYILLTGILLVGCLPDRAPTASQKEDIVANLSQYHAVLNVEGQGELIVDPITMERGAAEYVPCGACHGPTGAGGVGPSLQGRDVEYITDRLTTYRSGGRVGGQSNLMWGQASGLSDEDINKLATYISNF